MNKILFLALAPFLLLANTFAPMEGRPVIDAANIIDQPVEDKLNQQLVDFYKSSGRQLVVATVPSLEGQTVEKYALDYFGFLGVGSKELNDGALFLVAPNDRQMRLEVAGGLGVALTDIESGRILDGVVKPKFKEGDFNGGVTDGVNDILTHITPEAIEKAEADRQKQVIADRKRSAALETFFSWVAIILGAVAALVAAFWFLIEKPRREKERMETQLRYERERAAAAKLRAAEDARIAEEHRLARIREERRRADLTPAQRAAEDAARAADEKRARDAERARRKAREEQEERDRQAAAERRKASSSSSSYSSSSYSGYSSSSSSSSYDSGSSYSGGGGYSDGGGASSSW